MEFFKKFQPVNNGQPENSPQDIRSVLATMEKQGKDPAMNTTNLETKAIGLGNKRTMEVVDSQLKAMPQDDTNQISSEVSKKLPKLIPSTHEVNKNFQNEEMETSENESKEENQVHNISVDRRISDPCQNLQNVPIHQAASLPPLKIDSNESSIFCLPNSIPVQRTPFDKELYQNTITEHELLSEESRSAFADRLRSTVRWREVRDERSGKVRRESNARIIHWSNNTRTLQVGSKVFDITESPLSPYHNKFYLSSIDYFLPMMTINSSMKVLPNMDHLKKDQKAENDSVSDFEGGTEVQARENLETASIPDN